MQMKVISGILITLLMIFATVTVAAPQPEPRRMRLWHKFDTARYRGTFVCLGDLTGSKRVDFLVLHQQGTRAGGRYPS